MSDDDVAGVSPADIDARREGGWILLDVRSEPEWQQVRIAGSVHIPMDEIVARLEEVPERVVCVCSVGARSARVALYLESRGRRAVNLDGGIRAWLDSGRSVDTASPG